MALAIVYTRAMKRDAKQMQKRGKNMRKLAEMLDLLASRQNLPPQYRDHQLQGLYRDFRECHIEPYWLLIYQVFEDTLVLVASGTGTHSDLFGK